MTYHIRQRLTPRGGNQFYKDRSDRKSETFCGAPCTEYDAAWADRKRAGEWVHAEKGLFDVCPACKDLAVRS